MPDKTIPVRVIIQVKAEVHITVLKEALQIKAEITDIIIHIKTDKGIVR